MRFFTSVFLLFLLGYIYSNNPKNRIENTDPSLSKLNERYNLIVETQASLISWKGSDLTKDHSGTIEIERGNLVVDGEQLVSGSFVIDMNTIVNKDLPTQKMKDLIVDHLKGKDFFDVEKYPESVFTMVKVEPIKGSDSSDYKITGNLRMKNIERSVSFAAKVTREDSIFVAQTAPFKIDRTKWNIEHASKNIFANLKDNIIKDSIELQIKIVAKAQ